MPPSSSAEDLGQRTGKVKKVFGEFGFIACYEFSETDVYYKASRFRGSPPLKEGDAVGFHLKRYGERLVAHRIIRAGDMPDRLLDWAYLGHLPKVLGELQEFALDERWEFKNKPRDPDRPLPILYNHLLHTYGRLVFEGKVLVNDDAGLTALNTGLVDSRYEMVYALFLPNRHPRTKWRLEGFCVAGEGVLCQKIARHFNPLPSAAHYFDKPADLLYDTRVGKPELDWRHIIIDRLDRYPAEFLEDHLPSGTEVGEVTSMSPEDRKQHFKELGEAIESNNKCYRGIMNRVKDAVNLAIKRTSWNFKTAVPQYYPRIRRLQLLLPICLISDERVDVALAVEKTDVGSYIGHTVLSLDWAYMNARLICRPDSDWLEPGEIDEGLIEEEEEDEEEE